MDAPERIYHISRGIFSVVRHYGGCTIQGRYYVYDPTADTLTREDVLKREKKEEREKRKGRKDEQEGLWPCT